MLLATMARKGPLAVLNDANQALQLRVGLKGLQSSQILDKHLLEQISSGVDNLIKKYMNDMFAFMTVMIAQTDDQNHKALWQQMLDKLMAIYSALLDSEIALAEEQQRLQAESEGKPDVQHIENQLSESHKVIMSILESTQKEFVSYIYARNQIPKEVIKNLAVYTALQSQHKKIVDNYIAKRTNKVNPQKIHQIINDQKIDLKHALVRSDSHIENTFCAAAALAKGLNNVAKEEQTPDKTKKLLAQIKEAEEEISNFEVVFKSKQIVFDRHPNDPHVIEALDNARKNLNEAKAKLHDLKRENSGLLFEQKIREAYFDNEGKSKRASVNIPPSQIKAARKEHFTNGEKRLQAMADQLKQKQKEKSEANLTSIEALFSGAASSKKAAPAA